MPIKNGHYYFVKVHDLGHVIRAECDPAISQEVSQRILPSVPEKQARVPNSLPYFNTYFTRKASI